MSKPNFETVKVQMAHVRALAQAQGIYTVEDFRRNELINGISDASKDLYGCRMRLEWDEYTIEALETTYKSICDQLNAQFEEEKAAAEFAKTCKGLPLDCEPLPYEEYSYLEEA